MNIRIWCSLVLVAVASCGGGSAPVTERPLNADLHQAPRDTIAESIFSVDQDTAISPLLTAWPDHGGKEVEAVASDTPPGSETETSVYRVQIYTTKDRATAQAVKDEAEVDFGREVHLDYEVPYYKVRVGTYQTPQEAEPLLQEARRLGYRGAWAVRLRAPDDEY
jgi:hypothetical protein